MFFATKLPFLPEQGKLPHSLLPLFLQRSAMCHPSCFIAVLFPSGRVRLLKMMLSTPPFAILLVLSVFCSRQVWSESVLNWQGPGAVRARKSGKDPPWASTGLGWVLHLPAFFLLLLNGNNEERFTSLEQIQCWVRTAGVQMHCTSEMFVISKLAEVRISGNQCLWWYACFYMLVLKQWKAWPVIVQLVYIPA